MKKCLSCPALLGNTVLVTLQILSFLWTTACSNEQSTKKKNPVRPVKHETVGKNTQYETRSLPGVVQAAERVDLSFRVSGPLIELAVKEGQQVKAGDIIARIDPRDYKNSASAVRSSVQQASAQLKGMTSGERSENIEVLKAALKTAEAQHREAQTLYNSTQELYGKGSVSRVEYERIQSRLDVTKAQVETAKQQLKMGQSGARLEDREAMQAQIAGLRAQMRQAESALEDTSLVAPFSGTISRVFVENFQDVTAKQPIVSLQDLSELEIKIQVPEKLIATAQRTQVKAKAAFEEFSTKRYPVTVKKFDMEPDRQTRTYGVTMALPKIEDFQVLSGMSVTVYGTFNEQKNDKNETLIFIPLSAVFANEKKEQYIWTIDTKTMTVARRKVKVGKLLGDRIEIKSGLKNGEVIATSGVHHLRDKQKVRFWENRQGADNK